MNPLDTKEIMNVAVAIDQNYFYYTYVMLYSLFENNPESEVHVYIFNQDLSAENISAYTGLAENFGGVIHNMKMDASLFSEELPIINHRWTVAMYYRLALVDLLPENVDRIWYLDADVIVNKSLYEMYHSDFGDAMLKACKSYSPTQRPFTDARQKMFEMQLANGYSYFNSGVLLFNIQKMRGRYCLKSYLDALKDLNYQVVAPDQDLLNWVHWQEVSYMDEDRLVHSNRYNMFSRYAANENRSYEWVKEEAYIIHFAGYKPWNGDTFHYKLELLWWEYAKKTPYYSALLDEYLYKTMTDPHITEYLGAQRQRIEVLEEACQKLREENVALKQSLDESIEMNNTMLDMLSQKC